MTVTPDFAAYEAKRAVMSALEADVLPLNKAALFDALEVAGIHTIVVIFDGSGDSGQIESVDALLVDNTPVDLPRTKITFRTVSFERLEVGTDTLCPDTVIERLAYDFLEKTHDGWENNDGAYGEFTFAVAERSITLEYNERHMESDYHCHEF